jgi:hypothetical protein
MDLVLIISLLLLALAAICGHVLKRSSPWKGEGPSALTNDQQRSGGGHSAPQPRIESDPHPFTTGVHSVSDAPPPSRGRRSRVRVFFDLSANHARTPSGVSRQSSQNTRRDPEGAPAASVHAPKSRDARLTPALG